MILVWVFGGRLHSKFVIDHLTGDLRDGLHEDHSQFVVELGMEIKHPGYFCKPFLPAEFGPSGHKASSKFHTSGPSLH